MKFRNKPVEIEAFQWQGDFDALDEWLNSLGYSEDGDDGAENGPEGMHESSTEDFVLIVPTRTGEMKAQRGDWILRDVDGEFYPCKRGNAEHRSRQGLPS